MKEEATPSGVSTPSITSIIKIKIATAGRGIDSLIIRIKVVKTMINVRCPSEVSPSGEGK